ncbi:MAG: paraquat-inducible protein A [Luteolibacter sp.]
MSVHFKDVKRGANQGLAACHTCEKVSSVNVGKCPRCGSHLHLRKTDSITRTLALVAAATLMYIPANILPIMGIRELGVLTESTIVAGLIQFWQMGSYPIAIVIFTASILIPFLKIGALLWLCAAAKGYVPHSAKVLGKVYWITELLGRWSMVDIFVVAILVTMVQLGNYMTVTPLPGALAFAGVVILTMFAAMSFDPKLLWDQLEREEANKSESQKTSDSE